MYFYSTYSNEIFMINTFKYQLYFVYDNLGMIYVYNMMGVIKIG